MDRPQGNSDRVGRSRPGAEITAIPYFGRNTPPISVMDSASSRLSRAHCRTHGDRTAVSACFSIRTRKLTHAPVAAVTRIVATRQLRVADNRHCNLRTGLLLLGSRTAVGTLINGPTVMTDFVWSDKQQELRDAIGGTGSGKPRCTARASVAPRIARTQICCARCRLEPS